MKGRIPVLGHMTTVDEGILKNMGDEALGVVSSGWYSAAIDTPANKVIVDLTHKIEAGALKPDPSNMALLVEMIGV